MNILGNNYGINQGIKYGFNKGVGVNRGIKNSPNFGENRGDIFTPSSPLGDALGAEKQPRNLEHLNKVIPINVEIEHPEKPSDTNNSSFIDDFDISSL